MVTNLLTTTTKNKLISRKIFLATLTPIRTHTYNVSVQISWKKTFENQFYRDDICEFFHFHFFSCFSKNNFFQKTLIKKSYYGRTILWLIQKNMIIVIIIIVIVINVVTLSSSSLLSTKIGKIVIIVITVEVRVFIVCFCCLYIDFIICLFSFFLSFYNNDFNSKYLVFSPVKFKFHLIQINYFVFLSLTLIW